MSHIGQPDPAVLQAIAEACAAQTGVAIAPDARALAENMQQDFVVLHEAQ